jgi:hypothetical protein
LALKKGNGSVPLNRKAKIAIEGVFDSIFGDINTNELIELKKHKWDVFHQLTVSFTPVDIERDLELFRGKTKQYISSASRYQTPLSYPVIKSTPLCNNLWDYSQGKIQCEDRLQRAYREKGSITNVSTNLTYDTVISIAIGGDL